MRWIGLLTVLAAFAAPTSTPSALTAFDPAPFLGLWTLEGVDPAGQGTLMLEYRGPLGELSVFVGGSYVDATGRRCEIGGHAGVSDEGEALTCFDLWCADWSASVAVMRVDAHHAKGKYEFWPGAWDTRSERARPAPREGVATLSRPQGQ